MSKADSKPVSIFSLIFIPSLITLAITVFRVYGEFQNWSQIFFNRGPGGPGALVGISWLPVIFGVYFAYRLVSAGRGPASTGAAIGYSLLGIPLLIGGFVLILMQQISFPGKPIVAVVLLLLALFVPMKGWGAMWKTLFAYALAARIPVLIVMYFALKDNWGTHYDATPPNFDLNMAFWPKYVQLAVFPQVFFWIGYTVVLGSLFGSVGALFFRKREPASEPAGQPA